MKSLLLLIACAALAGCVRAATPEPQVCPLQCEEFSCQYDSAGIARICECME